MAQPLSVAIDTADAHNDSTDGISVFAVLSMHADDGSSIGDACLSSPVQEREVSTEGWGVGGASPNPPEVSATGL